MPVVMVVVLIMAMVMVVVIFAQKPSAQQVHTQTDYSHHDGLIEANWDRLREPLNALPPDKRQDHGTRKPCKITDFSSAEGEEAIVRVFPCLTIRQNSDKHSCGMCGHVPATGNQGH